MIFHHPCFAVKSDHGWKYLMTKLEKIEKDIEALEPGELARFRTWFAEFDAANWDAQIEADAKAGRLDPPADKALTIHRAERTRPP
jgi:hypothetical protein